MDKVLKETEIWTNPVMRVKEFKLEDAGSGVPYYRGVLDVQDAVAVLAKNTAGEYVFVRQPRWAVQEDALLEMVAGKIDPGETPGEAAVRETEEETGMLVQIIKPLGAYYPSPAYLTETIHLFFAEVIDGGTRGGDDLATVKPVTISTLELTGMIQQGDIKDGKLLAALGARQIIYGKSI
jgi:ADP-ribose pyrophosphatase